MPRRPRLLFAATALAAVVLLPLPGGFDVFDSSIYLLVEDDRQDEDAYVLADTGIVDGVLDGDLVIAAADLTIRGTVTGDVLVASAGTVVVGGVVEGSVRGLAREIRIDEGGSVGDDLAVAALTTTIRGTVGRDVIVFGGKFDLTGRIGRNVRGRFVEGDLDGAVGRNIDVATRSLGVGGSAAVDGSFLYRSNREAEIDPAAVVVGTFKRLSPRPSFFVDVWWTLAEILGFFGFLFSGIVALWLLRDTSARAVAAIVNRPWRSLAFGAAAVVLVPLAVLSLVVSLVGVPVAVLVGVLYLLGFFFGPIPAVAAAGTRLPGGRGSLFGAFVVGAVAWRLGISVLSFVAGALYVFALLWGIGGWVGAVWDGRRAYSSSVEASTTAST